MPGVEPGSTERLSATLSSSFCEPTHAHRDRIDIRADPIARRGVCYHPAIETHILRAGLVHARTTRPSSGSRLRASPCTGFLGQCEFARNLGSDCLGLRYGVIRLAVYLGGPLGVSEPLHVATAFCHIECLSSPCTTVARAGIEPATSCVTRKDCHCETRTHGLRCVGAALSR